MQADAIHAIPNATTANSSIDQDAAAHRLQVVHLFAFGGVGFAGIPSQGEVAYHSILAAPKGRAIELLLHAWHAGTPEAKAYALTGMRDLSDYQFQELAAEARASKHSVLTMQGCIVSRTTLAQIAADLLSTHEQRAPSIPRRFTTFGKPTCRYQSPASSETLLRKNHDIPEPHSASRIHFP